MHDGIDARKEIILVVCDLQVNIHLFIGILIQNIMLRAQCRAEAVSIRVGMSQDTDTVCLFYHLLKFIHQSYLLHRSVYQLSLHFVRMLLRIRFGHFRF